MNGGAPHGEQAIDRLEKCPRTRLAFLPTPLIELERLSSVLRGPRLWIKRDDLTGIGLGGNKTRKLEFLIGDALSQGCDAVVTGGAAQSNHCRQTAAAAASTGLECHLALGGEPRGSLTGNLLLDHLFGAIVHWCGEHRKGEPIPEIADQLRSQGRRPYIIPYGGSNATGALGYVAAIGELSEQLRRRALVIEHLVVASSSGGTQAGMIVGAHLHGLATRVAGVAVDKGEAGEGPYEERLAALADQIAEKLGMPERFPAARFRVRYEYLGGGYGVVGDREREAIQLLARREGVLLDPVYTARAMGGLIDMIRKGEFGPRESVLFWHTGGTPAIFAYGEELAGGAMSPRF